MSEYVADLRKRLATAKEWAARVERERPDDHAAISRAKQHVRRMEAKIKEQMQ